MTTRSNSITPEIREIHKQFQSVVTPHISDNMGRHIGVRGLNRYNKTGKMVGSAFTVKTRPGDNLYIYKALTMLEPGHVLVVDAQGDTTNAVIGELIKLYALQRGCAGFVINGAIRDVACFENTPCYARDVVHCGPYKTGPGAVNVPVSIGGMVVNPGDIIVGDEDGIIGFPLSAAHNLLALARSHEAAEERVKAEIATGALNQSWIESTLIKANLA